MQEKFQFPLEGVYLYIVQGRNAYLYIGLLACQIAERIGFPPVKAKEA